MKPIFKFLTRKNSDTSDQDQIYNQLEIILGYNFHDRKYLADALNHPSITPSGSEPDDFERMEFLGDSILGLIVARELYTRFPDYNEGQLSKLKSKLVSRKYLALKARSMKLGDFINMSSEAVNSGGRDSGSILSDTLEAIICAIFLDSSLEQVRKIVLRLIISDYEHVLQNIDLIDYKSRLQEITQARLQVTPEYRLISESGPDHDKTFTIEVFINDTSFGLGRGNNKKNAEQDAARHAYSSFSES